MGFPSSSFAQMLHVKPQDPQFCWYVVEVHTSLEQTSPLQVCSRWQSQLQPAKHVPQLTEPHA
jgi:hypothetical protein